MEERLLALQGEGLSGGDREAAIRRIAGELDEAGYNVSRHGGHLLALRRAVDRMESVGSPLLKDLGSAIETLTLEDAADPYGATRRILDQLQDRWPELKQSERRPEVIGMVEKAKLDLLVSKAKSLPDDKGIRLLIEEEVDPTVIVSALEITEEKRKEVEGTIQKERAERERVAQLLEKIGDRPVEEKVKHLIENNVSDDLIVEMAQIDQGVIDAVKKAMEEELKEKQRLAEEEAARKKKEAEGPALEDIPPEEMLGHIEAIREIMEFSDQEKEIRVMCEQSAIPKALVDMAVSEPEKLDALEKKAEG
jgi:hypothetical protein